MHLNVQLKIVRFSKDLDGNSVLVVKELGEVPGPV